MEREELLSLPITMSFTIVISYRYSKSPFDHCSYNLKIDPFIEHVLIESCHLSAIQGAADWCGQKLNCPIARDPTTKRRHAQSGNWVYAQVERREPRHKWRSVYLSRDKLSINIPVYVTEAHYDDHSEHLMEYVRKGGGLIGIGSYKARSALLGVLIYHYMCVLMYN